MSRRRSRDESWSSDEAGSSYSGSSVDIRVDGDGRRGYRVAGADNDRSSSYGEDSKIRRSLQRKLLSNHGARLSRIERRLLRADRSREGAVSVATFKAALAAASESDRFEIRRREMLWLTRRLAGRNGRNVTIFKMRRLLEDKDGEQGRRPAGGGGQGRRTHRRRSESRLRRGMSTDETGSDGRTGSESGRSSRGGALNWRSSPTPPARWAIRQGTVGQWLHEVAAPMERKLFFEFLRDLEKFESRNGLDHYRVRPGLAPRRRRGHENGDDGVGSRHFRDDGTTVVHLGPMLKAAIKFYV